MGRRKKAKLKRAALLTAATQSRRAKVKGHTTPRAKNDSRAKATADQRYTVGDLLEKVDECVDSFQVELACKFAERALELEPDNILVLDTLAPLLLETGLTDRAVQCFEHCISLSPDIGYAKYLYMGQLSSAEEAVGYLTKGIAIMEREMEERGREACAVMADDLTNGDISAAYCTLAEIYLTDSCFSEGASENCHKCCNKAVDLSPSNPEAHQLLASCLLSQGKQDEAKESLMRGISLWLPSKVGGASHSEGASNDVVSTEGSPLPPYFSRINTAKLLMEVQEFDSAFEVLEGLLREDDEVVVVWYLMGWLHYLTKDADSARFYLEQTQTLFSKLECEEVEILEHTRELLDELGPEEKEALAGEEMEAGEQETGDDGESKESDDGLGDSDNEQLEEDAQLGVETDNMDLS